MAGRWSEKKDVAQISCFFSSKAEVTEDTIQSFEYSLKNVLQEASITETSENPSARLWVDAYSADGKITLVNGRNTPSVIVMTNRNTHLDLSKNQTFY